MGGGVLMGLGEVMVSMGGGGVERTRGGIANLKC